MDKPLLRKQTCVLEHFKAFCDTRCSLLLLDLLQLGDLRLNLRPGNQVLPPQLLQFLSPQAGPPTEFYQFIVVRLGKMFVPHPVPPAPLNLLTVSLGRLKVILVIRGNPVYDAIMEAAEAGIVFGFGDGTFQPNSPVTYAQFSALLGRAFYPSELDFSDYDSWYEPYTIVLSEHNVLLNLESDKLDNSLSIFDMAQLLYNVLVDYCIFSPSDPPFISSLDNLHLLDNIPSEYHSAIRTIYSLGLLDDFFDLFSTGDIRISRAQACIVINRLSSYLTPGNKTTLSGLIIGGQLTVSETTPIDAKILLSNAGCDVFSYSAILALKYYKEGSWVDIPFNSPDNTVSEVAILHQLMPGQEKVFTFDLSYYYGSISEGYYKLEIVLTQNGKNYSLSDIFFISN